MKNNRVFESQEKVVLIDHRFRHHGAHSGYKQLSRYLTCSIAKSPSFLRFVPDKVLYRLPGMSALWYDRESVETELALIPSLVFSRGRLFHFLYGENSLKIAPALNSCGWIANRVIATYHQLPSVLSVRPRITVLATQLDAVIVVSATQASYFNRLLSPDRIHVVRHGVDAEFFRPPDDRNNARDDFEILSVGSNYRNLDLHASVIRNLTKWSTRIHFTVIGDDYYRDYYRGIPNLDYRTSITDDDLRVCYQRSDLLLLPLKDATACNALVEGMACGVPIVVTNVGGVSEYVDASCAALVPQDSHAMSDVTIELLRQPTIRSGLGLRARERAVTELDWSQIARELCKVYDLVMGR
jgi:glycosyltransferase involved in cell wall biosynthesis